MATDTGYMKILRNFRPSAQKCAATRVKSSTSGTTQRIQRRLFHYIARTNATLTRILMTQFTDDFNGAIAHIRREKEIQGKTGYRLSPHYEGHIGMLQRLIGLAAAYATIHREFLPHLPKGTRIYCAKEVQLTDLAKILAPTYHLDPASFYVGLIDPVTGHFHLYAEVGVSTGNQNHRGHSRKHLDQLQAYRQCGGRITIGGKERNIIPPAGEATIQFLCTTVRTTHRRILNGVMDLYLGREQKGLRSQARKMLHTIMYV